MSAVAVVWLEREEQGRMVGHRIGIDGVHASPLQALRAAHDLVEDRWEHVSALIDSGETLRIEIRSS